MVSPLPPGYRPVDDDKDDEALEDAGHPKTASEQHTAPAWLVDLRQTQYRRGFYQSLGDHAVLFTDRGSDHLVVSFDNLSSVRDPSIGRDPWAYGFVARGGWSCLGVMSFAPDWFRDEELINYLQNLSDRGFFRRFASVTMIGTSMGGYAACAFSGLAPGCRVIAFSPQSTLRKDLVPWEKRFSAGRKADWSGRFADAATQTMAASQVWLVFDPALENDLRHATRFAGPNIHLLRARHGGHKTALFLRRAGVLSTVVRDVIEGRMSDAHFYRLYRSGRMLPWYLHGLAEKAQQRARHDRIGRLVQFVRNSGHAFAAQTMRRKFLTDPAPDPLRAGHRPASRAPDERPAGDGK